jgi:aminoglycoside phosphotransferase (APT) family kinase protein
LPLLLDNEAMAGILRAHWLDGVTNVCARYVRYKPGTSCLVSYQAQWAGSPLTLYAKGYPKTASAKLEKASQRLVTQNRWRPAGFVLRGMAIAVFPSPTDQVLASLALVAQEGDRAQMLSRILPDRPDLWHVAQLPLRYKPERRYVAQLIADGKPMAVLKLYDRRDYQIALRNAKGFMSRGPLRIAPRLGRSNHHRALVLAWLPGTLLESLLVEPTLSDTRMQMVGAALAELHGQRPRRLRRLRQRDEHGSLQAAACAVAAVAPDLAEPVRALTTRLATRLLRVPARSVSIHGDFSADQVLLTDSGAAILDLDSAARCHALVDLGSFAAALELNVLWGALSANRAAAAMDAVLTGYRTATGVDLFAGLSLHTAAGLLRLAVSPFRNREPDWPWRIEAIVARAETMV